VVVVVVVVAEAMMPLLVHKVLALQNAEYRVLHNVVQVDQVEDKQC
jgi:hypothetical protein